MCSHQGTLHARSFAIRPFSCFPLVTVRRLRCIAGPRSPPTRSSGGPTTTRPARKRIEKGLPLFLVIGTDNCFYCRKLEAGPFRDPAIATQLDRGNFIPLKVDANKEPNLAKALKVQIYPDHGARRARTARSTAFIEGYLETDRLDEQLNRTAVTTATTTDWAARDFNQATKALAVGEYPRAVSLLKGIVKDAGDEAGRGEGQADSRRRGEARSRAISPGQGTRGAGFTQEAVDTLAEAVKTYSGTQAAADAATLMTGLAAQARDSGEAATAWPRGPARRRARRFPLEPLLRLPSEVRPARVGVRRHAGGQGSARRSPRRSRATRSGWRRRATR